MYLLRIVVVFREFNRTLASHACFSKIGCADPEPMEEEKATQRSNGSPSSVRWGAELIKGGLSPKHGHSHDPVELGQESSTCTGR